MTTIFMKINESLDKIKDFQLLFKRKRVHISIYDSVIYE